MTTQHSDTADRSSVRTSPRIRLVYAAGVVAGLLGPLLFVGVAVTLGVLRPGYSFVANPIVALFEGPTGWIQNINFVVVGVMIVAFAIGLHLDVRRTSRDAIGPTLIGASGIGPLWAGLTAPMPVHFAVTFVSAGLGFVVLSRRLARDPHYRGLAAYALLTGIAILVVLPVHSLLALPVDGPLHPWWGALNWSTVVLWMVGIFILAVRLAGSARGIGRSAKLGSSTEAAMAAVL